MGTINKNDIIQAAYDAGFECEDINNEYELAREFLVDLTK